MWTSDSLLLESCFSEVIPTTRDPMLLTAHLWRCFLEQEPKMPRVALPEPSYCNTGFRVRYLAVQLQDNANVQLIVILPGITTHTNPGSDQSN